MAEGGRYRRRLGSPRRCFRLPAPRRRFHAGSADVQRARGGQGRDEVELPNSAPLGRGMRVSGCRGGAGAGRGEVGRARRGGAEPCGGGARLERAGAAGAGALQAFVPWPSRRLAQMAQVRDCGPVPNALKKACRGRQGRSVIITRYQSCSKMVEMLGKSLPALPGLVSQAPPLSTSLRNGTGHSTTEWRSIGGFLVLRASAGFKYRTPSKVPAALKRPWSEL